MKRAVFALVAILCLLSVSSITGLIHLAKADGGTITINADGSITPSSAPITTVDNVTYTFTGNVNESIVVERDSIVVDGRGYMVQGTGSGTGIMFSGRSNETIKNTEITAFSDGIWLNYSNSTISGNNITNNGYGIELGYSSNCSISGNNITTNQHDGIWLYHSSNSGISGNNITTNNRHGILLTSSNSTISGNNVANNQYDGIWLDSSSNSTVSGNNIANNGFDGILLDSSSNCSISENQITTNNGNAKSNGYGIELDSSSNCSISGNNVANNFNGIWLYFNSDNNTLSDNNVANNAYGIILDSSANFIFHNSFVNNTNQVYTDGLANIWDNGYPSGGNYWSDYVARYPNALETDASGVMNTPYVIDANNVDRYPLIPELSPIALRANLVALDSSYLGLKTDYDALNASYNSLNASFRDYQQTTQNELANVTKTLYVFMAVTAILAVALAYMATKNKRFKNEDKGTSTP
jgi:parallel beta-helix repeat protein